MGLLGSTNFGEFLYQLSNKIKAFFGDEDAAIHYQSLEEVNERATKVDQEIFRIVESEKVEGPRIPFFSDLKDGLFGAVKGVGGMFKFVGKNIVVLIILIGIGFGLFYLGVFKKMGDQ